MPAGGSDPNAPANKSRAQSIVNPGEGTVGGTVTGSCSVVLVTRCTPPRSDNAVHGSVYGDNDIVVTFRLKDSAAPFGLAPDLDGTIMLVPFLLGSLAQQAVLWTVPRDLSENTRRAVSVAVAMLTIPLAFLTFNSDPRLVLSPVLLGALLLSLLIFARVGKLP